MSYPTSGPDGSYPQPGPAYPYQPPAPQSPAPQSPPNPYGEQHYQVSGAEFGAAPTFPQQAQPAAPQIPTQQGVSYAPGVAGGYNPAAPVSGPTYGDPYGGVPATTALPAVSGPPVSAPGYGQPTYAAPGLGGPGYPPPGYPTSGYPGSGVPAPAPVKKGHGALIFGILAVIFFIATATLAPLYILKGQDYDKKVTLTQQQMQDIQTKQSKIDDLNKQLTDKQTTIDQLTQKNSGTQSQLDETAHEKQVISQCLTLYSNLVDAYFANKTVTQSMLDQEKSVCAEADKYLQ